VLGTDPTVRVGDPASVIAPGEGRCSRSGLWALPTQELTVRVSRRRPSLTERLAA